MSDSLDPAARRAEAAPLNVNARDLCQALSAAKVFVGKCREANERRRFDEGGARHLLSFAPRQFSEAISPFLSAPGLIGDDATVGAINALLEVAGDGQATPDIDGVEAVIAWITSVHPELRAPSADELARASESLETILVNVLGAPIITAGPPTSNDAPRQTIIRNTLAAAESWMQEHAGVIDRAENVLSELRQGADSIFHFAGSGYTSAHAAGRALVQDFYLQSYGWLTNKPLQFPLAKLDLNLVEERWNEYLMLANIVSPRGSQAGYGEIRPFLRKERMAVLKPPAVPLVVGVAELTLANGRHVSFRIADVEHWGPAFQESTTRDGKAIRGRSDTLCRLPCDLWACVREHVDCSPTTRLLSDEEALIWLLAGDYEPPESLRILLRCIPWSQSLAEAVAYNRQSVLATWRVDDATNQAPPATGGSEQSEGNAIPTLPERCYLALKTMLLENAVSADKSMTAVQIARKAEGKTANPESFKRPLATLKKRAYTDSKKGTDGGCWLTVKGMDLAKKL